MCHARAAIAHGRRARRPVAHLAGGRVRECTGSAVTALVTAIAHEPTPFVTASDRRSRGTTRLSSRSSAAFEIRMRRAPPPIDAAADHRLRPVWRIPIEEFLSKNSYRRIPIVKNSYRELPQNPCVATVPFCQNYAHEMDRVSICDRVPAVHRNEHKLDLAGSVCPKNSYRDSGHPVT